MIAAYRDLPPPLKELIDWDQQRLDVQVKYDQVVQHFSPERLLPVEEAVGERRRRSTWPARSWSRTCRSAIRMAARPSTACR